MSSKEFHNWCKLQSLLNTRASELLRNLFKKLWQARFNKDWDNSSGQELVDMIKKIKPKVLKPFQTKVLQTEDIHKWDLQLLRIVFVDSDICGTGNNYRKNADKLVEYRNKFEHNASRTVSSNDFGNYWANICNILVEMGGSKEEFGELKGSMNLQKIIIMQGQNIVKANELKNEGNKYFKKKKYDEAILTYTGAIDLEGIPDQDLAALYSCRSGCYFEKRDFENALRDAKKSKNLNREWYQAYLRIGKAYLELNELEKAKKVLERAVVLEPNSEEIKTLLSQTRNTKRIQDSYEHLDPGMRGVSIEQRLQDFKVRTGQDMTMEEFNRLLKFNESQNPILKDVWKGHAYRDGIRGEKQDFAKAAECYEKAAQKGNAEAMYNLAKMTQRGLGVKQDFAKAFSLLKRAAEQPAFDPVHKIPTDGVAEAEHSLGLSYSEGVYVGQDKLQAAYWYERAVEHGSAWSANNLGFLYMNGEGVKQDLKRAEQLFLLAASRNDYNAPDNLVSLYARQNDVEKASKWSKISLEKGSPFATTIQEGLESMQAAGQETLKDLGIIEWEKANNLASDGMTLSERTQRRLTFNQDPEFASLLEKYKNTLKEISIPQPAVNQHTGFKFSPDELERYSHTSETAKRMLDAMIHFVLSFGILTDILKDTQPIGLDNKLCRLFIARLAESYRIEHIVASFPIEKIPDVKNIAEKIISQIHTLRQKESLSKELSDLDQDARLCFAVLNLGSPKILIDFLSESLQKYPQNKDFFLFRGNGYSFEQRHEDGLRDYNRLLEMEPDNFYFLYLKAVSLRLLGHPNAVKAYEEYLEKAPIDDRKRPEAYYSMGNCTLYSSQQSKGSKNRGKNKENLMKKVIQEYYDLGLEMEGKQLPFFLPYVSNSKKALELVVNAQSFLDKKEQKTSKAGHKNFDLDFHKMPKEQVSQDLKPEVQEESKSAVPNDPTLQDMEMAQCYFEKEDYATAAKYLQKAIDKGNLEAMYTLAIMNQRGLGGKQDLALAFSLLKRVAEQPPFDTASNQFRSPVAEAEHSLGKFYSEGIFVQQNKSQAVYWYERAVEHEAEYSATELGVLYMNGEGVKQNLKKAEQLFLLAVTKFDEKAPENLVALYKMLNNPEKALKWSKIYMEDGFIFGLSPQSDSEMLDDLGIVEWEKEWNLSPDNLNLTQRIQRQITLDKDDEIAKYTKNFDSSARMQELEKYYDTSETARRMNLAEAHFLYAQDCFKKVPSVITLMDSPTREFVVQLAQAYRTEHRGLKLPTHLVQDVQETLNKIINMISSMKKVKSFWKQPFVKQILILDQESRLSYALLNQSSPKALIKFLSESISEFPEDKDFYRFRGIAFESMERHEDALRDHNKVLEMDPNNYDSLFSKAFNLQMLCHSNTIKAYEEYLSRAPLDDPRRPEVYYNMGVHTKLADMESKATKFKNHQEDLLKTMKEYYELGLEMEKRQLPFFLPYKSEGKPFLEHYFPPERRVQRVQPPSSTKKEKLGDPLRKELILSQRQCIREWGEQLSKKWVAMKNTVRPQKEQKRPGSLVGLKPVYLNEIDFTKDHVLSGYVLEVTVIDLPLYTGSSIILVVEDKNGNVQNVALYNLDESDTDVQELGVGSKFSILNPYIRMAQDGKPLIRVDDPSTVIFGEKIKNMCAYCGDVSQNLMVCGACKSAAYCSEACQKLDWKEFQHKLICKKR